MLRTAKKRINFRASARNSFGGTFSAKTGVLLRKTPVFAQSARRLSAIYNGFRVLKGKKRRAVFNSARSIFFSRAAKKNREFPLWPGLQVEVGGPERQSPAVVLI